MPVKKKDKKTKPKPKTRTITKTKNNNTNINNVHVHVEKKTRNRRTTKPNAELSNDNPLSNTIGVSRPASQNLGFHPRGLVDNQPQQPTIINITPSQDLERLQKKLKKYKDKLNQNKETQEAMNKDLLTQITSAPQLTQQPINVTVNPFQPEKTTTIKPEKAPIKKSVIRFPKSKTKSGTLFKPNELDETMSQASATPQKPPEPESDHEEEKRMKEEKKIESRYYTLVGNAQKGGAIVTAQIALDKLKERLKENLSERQRNKLNTSISKQEEKIKDLQNELKEVELKLKNIRASKPKPRTNLLSSVSSLFSPA
jgi:hypothetical protein